MEKELKQIPDTGTRKRRIDAVCYMLTVGWFLTMIASGFDYVSADWVSSFGVTFERWWVGVGLMLGGYVVSENGKKHSFAVLNRK